MTAISKIFAKQFPDLSLKLAQARIRETPESFLKRTLMLALFLSLSLCFIAFMFMKEPMIFLAFPFLYLFSFMYFMNYATAKVARMQKAIGQEIVFAGRFLIIELESGVPIYRAFQNLEKNYETVGRYFAEVVERVDLGTPIEEALNEAVQLSPSNDLRRMLWQILNSLKTGSEVADALNSVFDQIIREQQISVKEYGRKLNPMAMFYMMMAIIIPSLGTIMLIVLSTFLGLTLDMFFFSVVIGLNIIVQFVFLAIIKSQRPPVDI